MFQKVSVWPTNSWPSAGPKPRGKSLHRQRMDELTAEVRTKSDKIRRLAAAGYARADIARYLGIRYQFVYNVLSGPQPKAAHLPRGPAPTVAAEPESQEPGEPASRWVWTTVGKGGVIRLPVAVLASMGVTETVLRLPSAPRDEVMPVLDEYVEFLRPALGHVFDVPVLRYSTESRSGISVTAGRLMSKCRAPRCCGWA